MKRSPLLREQIAYLTQKLYGKSSEQTPLSGQIKRLDHVQHAYKCKHCSLSNESDKIVKALVPKAPLAHSYGSASIIAHTFYQKYELKVPAYRQENDWEKLLEQKFLHADETTYRVLESETVKTFYWTFLSDKQAKKPITLYHHDPHRSGQLAQATLVGCWAHVRRKFFEAVPPEASNKKYLIKSVYSYVRRN